MCCSKGSKSFWADRKRVPLGRGELVFGGRSRGVAGHDIRMDAQFFMFEFQSRAHCPMYAGHDRYVGAIDLSADLAVHIVESAESPSAEWERRMEAHAQVPLPELQQIHRHALH